MNNTPYKKFYGSCLDQLEKNDKELLGMLVKEYERQNKVLPLIASSSSAFEEVFSASASNIMNVTLEGYIGNRFHAGTQLADEVEQLAIDRAKEIFDATHVNVQPLSGSAANNAILFGLLSPGDTILSLGMNSGGHLTHGSSISISGKFFHVINYGLDSNELIDYDHLNYMARRYRPKLIIAGASAYTRLIDYQAFREIADRVGAYLLADISHISGLVAAKLIPSPIDHAHFTTTSTYKQLYGPRGGLICTGRDIDKKIGNKTLSRFVDAAIFPLYQGTPDMSMIAAKAAAFNRIQSSQFIHMMQRVLSFSKLFAIHFKNYGYRLVSGGSDNHMVVLDALQSKGITGFIAEKALEACNIIVNKNMIPNDMKPALITSGIRLGTNGVAALPNIDSSKILAISELINDILSQTNPVNDRSYHLDEGLIKSIQKTIADILN